MTTSEGHWARWRRHFPDLESAVYLDSASHGARSDRVARAFASYLDDWTVDPAWDGAWREAVEGAERRFGHLVGVDADEVVSVPTLTHAFHAVLGTVTDSERRRVVIAEDEWVSLRHALDAWPGAEPCVVPTQGNDDALLDAVDDRTAWLVASHVCFRTGRRRELRALSERAHAHGARLFVDAFQSAGVVPVDVVGSGADALAAGALKYLLGVPGVAFLAVRREVASTLHAGVTGWRGQRDPMVRERDPAPGARRFATGTWMVPAAYAATAGLNLLFEAGLPALHARVASLTAAFADELSTQGVDPRLPTDPERRSAIVVVPCQGAAEARIALREDGVVCTARDGALRFSFHGYLGEAEVRHAARRVAARTLERTPHAARLRT